MIISKRLKLALFRVPKTGSTTAEAMLRLSGAFTAEDILTAMPSLGLPSYNVTELESRTHFSPEVLAHMLPRQVLSSALLTVEELRAINCFAFVRDPIKRYVSAYLFIRGRMADVHDFRRVVKDGDGHPILRQKQVDYFRAGRTPLIRPLLYDRFEEILRALINLVGGYIGWELPKFKETPYSWHSRETPTADWVDSETMKKIELDFSEDFELYNRTQAEFLALKSPMHASDLRNIRPYG